MVELEHAARLTRERAATARELHDVIAGHLSSIALQTSALTGADADRVPLNSGRPRSGRCRRSDARPTSGDPARRTGPTP
ncbi:histidine kinase [Nakamurella sp. A5-74]|uniref:Histidine kinase n=1 Tax=Nakamurella sp. A5-74 TaxID=3158264 RepID=A0AAU8DYE8_9ACTN